MRLTDRKVAKISRIFRGDDSRSFYASGRRIMLAQSFSRSCRAKARRTPRLSDVASKITPHYWFLQICKDELEDTLAVHSPHVHVHHGVGQLHHFHRNLALPYIGKILRHMLES